MDEVDIELDIRLAHPSLGSLRREGPRRRELDFQRRRIDRAIGKADNGEIVEVLETFDLCSPCSVERPFVDEGFEPFDYRSLAGYDRAADEILYLVFATQL